MVIVQDGEQRNMKSVEFAWLEITPSCQLHCFHCYRESMPGLGHGQLKIDDWKSIIASLHSMGTQYVQFIGGEPTIHPGFCELLTFAAEVGLSIEVYTNLIGITPRMWELFSRYHVHIATSFYTNSPEIHDAITATPGSYQKTLTNIKKVLAFHLPLRVGMVRMREDQNIDGAKVLLSSLGVKRIGVDRARGVGRGTQVTQEDAVSALCGKCIERRCVVTATGEVYPCIMSRTFPLGNVFEQDITAIVGGDQMQQTVALLTTAFTKRHQGTIVDCGPDDQDCDPECDPQDWPACDPDCCPATVASCEPSEDDDE
jgi:MoaA/NifB/PqqE/SkfB family radical SAM enzyme